MKKGLALSFILSFFLELIGVTIKLMHYEYGFAFIVIGIGLKLVCATIFAFWYFRK